MKYTSTDHLDDLHKGEPEIFDPLEVFKMTPAPNIIPLIKMSDIEEERINLHPVPEKSEGITEIS